MHCGDSAAPIEHAVRRRKLKAQLRGIESLQVGCGHCPCGRSCYPGDHSVRTFDDRAADTHWIVRQSDGGRHYWCCRFAATGVFNYTVARLCWRSCASSSPNQGPGTAMTTVWPKRRMGRSCASTWATAPSRGALPGRSMPSAGIT